MPNKQRNRYMQRSRPAVARPQDGLDRLGDNKLDEDDTRVSDDGARDTSMSSARGGFGGFGGGRHRDSRHSSPSPAARGDARGGFGSRSHNGLKPVDSCLWRRRPRVLYQRPLRP